MASWLYCIPPNLMVVQCFYYVFWLNLSNSNILDKPDAQCWPNSASLYWKLSAHHKPFCWLAHFAGWHILLFVGYQFPPQHCHSCHSYWGHFLSLLHFVTRTRLDFLDFRANSHLKVFQKKHDLSHWRDVLATCSTWDAPNAARKRSTSTVAGSTAVHLTGTFAAQASWMREVRGHIFQGQSGVGNCPILGILDITW